MTTKSYPYNVVITRDPLVLDKIFFDKLGRTSFANRLAALNEDEKVETLIVSPRSNDNFISLDVNFSDKVSGQGAKYVLLKLLETSKLLEYFSISTNALQELMISRAKVKKAIIGTGKVLDEFMELRPRFYLSFGLGDDIKEWAGPYNLDLVDANISITSDGVREMELMFSPTVESMVVFTNKLFNDFQHGQADSVFDTAATKKSIIRSVGHYKLKENGQANAPDDEWNYCVRDIVSRFISERFPTVPPGNTLFLMPDDLTDFFTVANPQKRTIEDIAGHSLRKLGIDISLDYESAAKKKSEQETEDFKDTALGHQASEDRALKAAKEESKKTIEKVIDRLSADAVRIHKELEALRGAENAGSPADRRLLREWERALKRYREIQLNTNLSEDMKLSDQIVLFKSWRHGAFWDRKIEEAYKANPTFRNLSWTHRMPFVRGVMDEFVSSPPIPAGPRRERDVKIKALTKQLNERKAQILGQHKIIKKQEAEFPNKRHVNRMENALWARQELKRIATEYRSNPDGNAVPTFSPQEFNQFILGMGGPVDPGAEDMANTLKTLAPLYTFTQGVYGMRGQKYIQDFTILEENDAKILKLLKKYDLIQSAESPVIIFGRLSIIKQLVYPSTEESILELEKTVSKGQDREEEAKKLTLRRMPQEQHLLKGRLEQWGEEVKALREAQSSYGFVSDVGTWKGYIQDFVKTFKPKAGFKTSSFGEGLGGDASMIKDLIKRTNSDNPLVFTHNVTNSNVLSLSFDSSPYKGDLLNYSTESLYKVMDAVFTSGELIADGVFTAGPLETLIKMAAKDVSVARESDETVDIVSVLKKTLSTTAAGRQLTLLSGKEDQVAARTFFDAVLLKAMSYSKSVQQKTTTDVISTSEAEILRRMNKAIIEVDIKTLPFFNIPTLPGRKCVLFGKPNLVRGATELRGRIESEPAFYTNAYTVIGYKNRITSTDAYSEFKLIQDSYAQGAELPNHSMALFFEEEINLAVESDAALKAYLKKSAALDELTKENAAAMNPEAGGFGK